ncbi:MAG TPA: S-methyl-5-thioribose-1-phosphate isomerase, partial [Dehalococcoidia bacterium]|nr:S-methyl-5-thioribose-1-phosphate isomerase [Dehalococcoidia bacterium]
TAPEVANAISTMVVRGAPLIGAAAAYGLCFAVAQDASDASIATAVRLLQATRPTAINLHHALREMAEALAIVPLDERREAAFAHAESICQHDIEINEAIGRHGFSLLNAAAPESRPVEVLTHCNAGRLATVAWGTALAPVYVAQGAGRAVHVWVSETRPRNQGAALTAWELRDRGIPYTLIADNAAGHLLQRGMVDLCIVGTDRTLPTGDVCNKIGTYLKALAAKAHDVPFYVAAPSPSIDWSLEDAMSIPIEERSRDEVTFSEGANTDGEPTRVRIAPEGSDAANFAFDVTPAHLVTGLITERGVCDASPVGLRHLFPERFTHD